MKEPHIEGVAIHDDPESCVGDREGDGEALTGAHAGWVLSREIRRSGVPTLLSEAEGHMSGSKSASARSTPRGRRPHARVEPFCRELGDPRVARGAVRPRAASGRPNAVRR
jgi:hypothetical protein